MSKRQRRSQEKRRRCQPIKRKLAAGAGLTIGATVAAAGTAHATDFPVNSLGDAGDLTCDATCTLRDAVDDANLNGGADRILFQSGLSGTIQLANPQLRISDPVEILGPGAGTLAVSTYAFNRIAYIYSDSNEPVLISGLTLTGATTAQGERSTRVGTSPIIKLRSPSQTPYSPETRAPTMQGQSGFQPARCT